MLAMKPISIKEACRHVARWHRHCDAPVGGLFAAAAAIDGEVVGVAIVSRPIARKADDGWTCEITRVATDGTHNACSMLYGACCRAAKALGYRAVITKTLASEPGTSLRAAGFVEIGISKGSGWSVPSRHRVDVDLFGNPTKPPGDKRRWIRYLAKEQTCPSK